MSLWEHKMASTIDHYVAAQEKEITQLRNALLIASQYANAFPNDPAIMPSSVEAWIKARLVYLIGLQTTIIDVNITPPIIPIPTLQQMFTTAPTAIGSSANASTS